MVYQMQRGSGSSLAEQYCFLGAEHDRVQKMYLIRNIHWKVLACNTFVILLLYNEYVNDRVDDTLYIFCSSACNFVFLCIGVYSQLKKNAAIFETFGAQRSRRVCACLLHFSAHRRRVLCVV